jgi:hypothetical protein
VSTQRYVPFEASPIKRAGYLSTPIPALNNGIGDMTIRCVLMDIDGTIISVVFVGDCCSLMPNDESPSSSANNVRTRWYVSGLLWSEHGGTGMGRTARVRRPARMPGRCFVKTEIASYREIFEALAFPSQAVRFLPNTETELDAATKTGIQTTHIV